MRRALGASLAQLSPRKAEPQPTLPPQMALPVEPMVEPTPAEVPDATRLAAAAAAKGGAQEGIST